MGRSPEFSKIEPSKQPQEPDVSGSSAVNTPDSPLIPQGTNWLSVDGGRTWGPRPRLTPAEQVREDQNQARLTENINLHRN